MLLNKQIENQDYNLKILVEQNKELSVEIEQMQKTDDLLRERLNRKLHAEEVIERNQDTITKAQDRFAHRDRFQSVICAKTDGLRTFGALSQEYGNPLRGSTQ